MMKESSPVNKDSSQPWFRVVRWVSGRLGGVRPDTYAVAHKDLPEEDLRI